MKWRGNRYVDVIRLGLAPSTWRIEGLIGGARILEETVNGDEAAADAVFYSFWEDLSKRNHETSPSSPLVDLHQAGEYAKKRIEELRLTE